MRITMTSFWQLLLLIGCCSWRLTSARPNGIKLQSQYLRAISAYRRLERKLPAEELRALTGIGLLNGARQAEEQMEQHLVNAIRELLLHTDFQQSNQVLPKIDEIEQQLVRDKRALSILSSAMDALIAARDEHQFRHELRDILEQQQHYEHQLQDEEQHQQQHLDLGARLGQLRMHILDQVPQMKLDMDTKIDKALQHLLRQASVDGPLAKASNKMIQKRAANEELSRNRQELEEEARQGNANMIKSILTEDDFRENLLEQQFEGSDHKDAVQPKDEIDEMALASANGTVNPNNQTSGKQEEDADAFPEYGGDDGPGAAGGAGGGGLVGIIGSLSGGEGGSDVGALIGALTGLISNLFGPGGLDIESLISTATSLLSGLLSGDKNFGVVLGTYVGTAFDGLSGGGGAINNGQFLGNFLGTVLASLSADPEDEGPPQPLTFTKNFLNGFIESKFRQNSAEASEERHGSSELSYQKKKKDGGGSSFDSGGFVKQIASHLVSSALGLLLNASLGASGGASHASAGLFSSSSQHMKSIAGRSWT